MTHREIHAKKELRMFKQKIPHIHARCRHAWPPACHCEAQRRRHHSATQRSQRTQRNGSAPAITQRISQRTAQSHSAPTHSELQSVEMQSLRVRLTACKGSIAHRSFRARRTNAYRNALNSQLTHQLPASRCRMCALAKQSTS